MYMLNPYNSFVYSKNNFGGHCVVQKLMFSPFFPFSLVYKLVYQVIYLLCVCVSLGHGSLTGFKINCSHFFLLRSISLVVHANLHIRGTETHPANTFV